MRIEDRQLVAAILAVAVLALTGCAGADPARTASPPAFTHPPVWTLTISAPSGDWRPCIDDAVVDEVDDADPTRIVIRMRTTATQTDAQTASDCITQHLTSGSVSSAGPID